MIGQWFSPSTPVSSTNKTDRHDITEILLKITSLTLTLKINAHFLNSIKITKLIFIQELLYTAGQYLP